ncbi:MAG: major capsid protein [Microvirus sp.]|nr:MAG: major capsid protein [Microvirus sp.]
MMYRNKSVSNHKFSMIPRADVPRSKFTMQSGHKTTFDAGFLVPVYVDEVLPGDSFDLKMTAFCRLSTPIFPLMDNMYLDTFFFYVPNRLLWSKWPRFMGEQLSPGSSTDFLVPQMVTPAGGYATNSLQDYLGLPTVGQLNVSATVSHSALPLRAYNLIYNEWFRDENLQNAVSTTTADGPDLFTDYVLLRRGKRHDYFTSCLPSPQKGTAASLPLGTRAPIFADTAATANTFIHVLNNAGSPRNVDVNSTPNSIRIQTGAPQAGSALLYADLTNATASTINDLRQAFLLQSFLEKDSRGGTRYTEIIRNHFGVTPPDYRLQRPEYLGGGSTPININPVAQTSATSVNGSNTPLGNLGAVGTGLANRHGFKAGFVEHGVVIGLACVRADMTYQQGLHRMWSRKTRYDFYWPVFANLGEQAVLNKEIFIKGNANDDLVFGYQERWGEYRYKQSQVSSWFRSTSATPLDSWHLAQNFSALPTLGAGFIVENPPVSRVVAVGDAANGKQFLFDAFFNVDAVRPMPVYSVPVSLGRF